MPLKTLRTIIPGLKLAAITTILVTLTGILLSWKNSHPTDDIDDIRKEYTRINTLPLQQQKFTYEAEGCVEEGVVTYFLEKQAIVKITESGSIGDGSWTNEYYYKAGKLIFCYELLIGGPAIGETTRTEYRYYIKNDRAIRCMENKTIIPVGSKATEAIQRGKGFLQAYQTKDFAAVSCE